METITKSAKETQKLGEKISHDLKAGDILALYGELGSGKTTFIQGIARGLGIKRRIISPTFIFIRPYAIRHTPYAKFLYHVDLYRIEKFKDTKGLGLEELFADKNAIIAIEWAEKIKKILPKKRTDIYFEYASKKSRRITINKLLK